VGAVKVHSAVQNQSFYREGEVEFQITAYRKIRVLFVLLCMIGVVSTAVAQTNNATVKITVTDSNSAAIAGARVTATSVTTRIKTSASSDTKRGARL
jgi:hypothetical protein